MNRKISTRVVCGWVAPIILVFGACGGGETPAQPAPPLNLAPVISGAASASVAENTSGSVLNFTASDPEGSALRFALGGLDASVFMLNSPATQLQLVAGLDFEAPTDANADNIYEVTITATDASGLSASISFRLTITDIAETFTARTLASGLAQPLQTVPVPGQDSLIIVQQRGLSRVLNRTNSAIATVPFLDVTSEVSGGGEQGLLGLAFSPDFATDRTIYVNLTNWAGNTEIRRYQTFAATPLQVDSSTEDLILQFNQPFTNHNAGWIGFDNNGDLLVPTGDGGSAGDPQNNAQNVNSLLGKILRLDVSGDDFPADPARDYAIPPTNPFATGGGAPEIYAIGLRNPFRASIDALTGALYIGDVGQNAVEEVSRIPDATPGLNFGWNFREGASPFNGGANSPAFTEPVINYPHGNGTLDGNSIIGGVVYRGAISELNETYIFGDTISNNIWFVPLASLTDGTTLSNAAFTRLNDLFPTGFGPVSTLASIDLDQDNNIILTNLSGDIFILEPAP